MRVVTTLEELLVIAEDRKVNGFLARQTLQLDIPSLARPALYRSQAALNRLQRRCGSLAGALIMFLAMVAGVIVVFDRHGAELTWTVFNECAVVLVLSFLLGVAGKMAALALTRWQFRRACVKQHDGLVKLAAGLG